MEISIVSPVSLEAGLRALQQAQHQEAIQLLEAFCHDCSVAAQLDSRECLRAQMHLAKLYQQTGQIDRATALCSHLIHCANAQVQIWAQQRLSAITSAPVAQSSLPETASSSTKPNLLNQVRSWLGQLSGTEFNR